MGIIIRGIVKAYRTEIGEEVRECAREEVRK